MQVIAKSVSIKDAGGKSGGRVSKAVKLIAGDLLHVSATVGGEQVTAPPIPIATAGDNHPDGSRRSKGLVSRHTCDALCLKIKRSTIGCPHADSYSLSEGWRGYESALSFRSGMAPRVMAISFQALSTC